MRIAFQCKGEHKHLHLVAVNPKQNCQADENEDGVGREDAGLEHPHGHAEKFWKPPERVDQCVDDPLVPPHGKPGKDAREPAGAVDADAINDSCVEED